MIRQQHLLLFGLSVYLFIYLTVGTTTTPISFLLFFPLTSDRHRENKIVLWLELMPPSFFVVLVSVDCVSRLWNCSWTQSFFVHINLDDAAAANSITANFFSGNVDRWLTALAHFLSIFDSFCRWAFVLWQSFGLCHKPQANLQLSWCAFLPSSALFI